MGSRAVGFLVLVLAVPPGLRAQSEDPDFLFGVPRGALSVRGGYSNASASSGVFDFFSEDLTIASSDFNSVVFGVDVAYALHPRIDLLVGFEHAPTSFDSESRDFEENDGSPIVQTTTLSTTPVTGGVKLYLAPRGRNISRFAFVPAKVRPYVGGGAGLIYYKLRQVGDFVDFVDLAIFTGSFQSDGWGLQAHAFGGVDIQLAPRWYVSIEGRYVWADADLSGDFVGFEPIDLNALRVTGGVSVSF